uniref:TIDP3705 n=1 Tax=Arundo donax TaxID=35708 RepID=A0A0A9F461_ARUDO
MSFTVVLLEPWTGQICFRWAKNHWFMVGSRAGKRRFWKDPQCAMPTVWPPESATRSVASRLILDSTARSWVTLEVGGGRPARTVCCDAGLRLSRLPRGTMYCGPPASWTESRAERATMSAQETTRPQAFSRRSPMSLMALNAAGRSVRLGGACCSLCSVGVESSRMEPSQPWTKQSWKWRRMSAAARPTFCWMADLRKSLTMDSAWGQLLL